MVHGLVQGDLLLRVGGYAPICHVEDVCSDPGLRIGKNDIISHLLVLTIISENLPFPDSYQIRVSEMSYFIAYLSGEICLPHVLSFIGNTFLITSTSIGLIGSTSIGLISAVAKAVMSALSRNPSRFQIGIGLSITTRFGAFSVPPSAQKPSSSGIAYQSRDQHLP